jgi:hypothetical protein
MFVEDGSPSLAFSLAAGNDMPSAPAAAPRFPLEDAPAPRRTGGPDHGGWEFFARLLVWMTRNNR